MANINFGTPPETRTLTNGFGDRRAAITPGTYVGGFGGIRTHDQRRMKTVHYHCATKPKARETLWLDE